jgi:glycosyltransferase involved in cell wall biosynthesis
MATAPIISIIIPTLNAARTLDECLASVRAQDYPADRVEIVMADAGSTDDTLAIAQRHGVERIVGNPLKTGEAGKSVAIKAATGEILALIDSDNILDDPRYLSRAARLFEDDDIHHVEPLYWTIDPADSMVNRYCALLGMNDPVSYFLGNYNRYSHLSRTFTRLPVDTVREDDDAVVVDVCPPLVPTFGANGFLTRRANLDGLNWSPYFFDIDVFQQAAATGLNRVAMMRTGITHRYCDSATVFRRKQARRIRDYLHHAHGRRRTYDYGAVPRGRFVLFALATATILPIAAQAVRGYLHKPDSAWLFHLPACWITLWEYGWGTVRGLFGTAEYDRDGWRQ